MITLYTFGPAFGLPDPSPFVMKAEVLLKMAGLVYRTDTKGLRRAPKGKLPYIEDDGERIADSTFIRWHVERKYGIDFDRGLARQEPGAARACGASAAFLGPSPFLFGRAPTAIDATALAFLAGALCPIFPAAARTAAEHHDNLRAYVGRMTARYYPERSEMAGCVAAA